MTAVDTTTPATGVTRSTSRLVTLWAAATAIAVLLVASAYMLAERLADPLVVTGGEVTLVNVTGFTIFGAWVGAVLAVGIGRFSRKPRVTFFAVTLIALAGYGVVPFTAAESIATALWLNLFHLVVAVPVLGLIAGWLPSDRAGLEA